MLYNSNETVIEILQGDITQQPACDAIVNAANAQLMPGGGVAGAIHRAAGPELAEACRPLAPIKPGEAVITKAFNLPNKFVIHCLGPIYGIDKPEDKLLRNCYLNALTLADKNNIKSIAFPAISTGIFGYPIEEAAEVAIKAIIDTTSILNNIKLVRIVLFDNESHSIHKNVLPNL